MRTLCFVLGPWALLLTSLMLPDAAFAADKDGDGYSDSAGDCDDTAPDIHPGATEVADGVDNDCDFEVDEGTSVYDDDGDGWTEKAGDCDDANSLTYPGAYEWADGDDNDCDGKTDEGTEVYDDDGDGWTEDAGDCDDTRKAVYPGATETVDSLDDDCDGVVDDHTAAFDDDHDGWTENDGDCNDANVWVWPGATEIGDQLDNDCDGIVDEGTDAFDDDGDGMSEQDGDCDDADPNSYPLATEVADWSDNDCDGVVDEGTEWYDDDGDGWTEDDGDCDDQDGWVYPGAPEVEDGKDQDCDDLVDEGTNAWDDDGDGFSEEQGDCADADPGRFPGADEIADHLDQDCNGVVDEGTEWYDDDADGFTEDNGDCDDAAFDVYPGAPELNDGVDNDCDGEIEQYVGWQCGMTGGSPTGGLGLVGGLLALATFRRRRQAGASEDAGPHSSKAGQASEAAGPHKGLSVAPGVLAGGVLATLALVPSVASAGLTTEVPDGAVSVRILECTDFQACSRDASFVSQVEGDGGQPFLPIELVFTPEDAGTGADADHGAAFATDLADARGKLASADPEGALKSLDAADAELRAWPATVPQGELFAFHYLRGAAQLALGADPAWELRTAGAIARVSPQEPALPIDDATVETAYLDQVRMLVTGGQGTLVLAETGTSAVYAVDGVPVGTSATLALYPGIHRVTAQHPASVREWTAEVPVLPARSVRTMATFPSTDDLPWVHQAVGQAFDELYAPAELTTALAAWADRHHVQRVELLRVEDVDLTRRDAAVRVSAADPLRPAAAKGSVIDPGDGVPGTFEDEIVAVHDAEAEATPTPTVRRVRVLFFDPRTQRFSTDPGNGATFLAVPEDARLTVGVASGMTMLMDHTHAAVDLDGAFRFAGPFALEARLGLLHTNEPYDLYRRWTDKSLYRVALGASWTPRLPVSWLSPTVAVLPEVYAPVAVGAGAEAGLVLRRGDYRLRAVGTAAVLDQGLGDGFAVEVGRAL